MHNYSASVLTLIDHTRNFTKKLNNLDLVNELNKKSTPLRLKEVVGFMKDLRNYIQHYNIPPLGASLEWNTKESKQRIVIKKEVFHINLLEL